MLYKYLLCASAGKCASKSECVTEDLTGRCEEDQQLPGLLKILCRKLALMLREYKAAVQQVPPRLTKTFR